MINFCRLSTPITARRVLENVLQSPACLSIQRAPVSSTAMLIGAGRVRVKSSARAGGLLAGVTPLCDAAFGVRAGLVAGGGGDRRGGDRAGRRRRLRGAPSCGAGGRA